MSKKRRTRIRKSPIAIIILIIILITLLCLNMCKKDITISKNDRTLVIGKQNLFAIYEDKLGVKIPFELSTDSSSTIKDLVDTKNYEKVLERFNEILPEKLNNYLVAGNDDLKLEVSNMKNIPEINVADKRHILTSSLHSMFREFYHGNINENILNENILVDVLNANGIGGYARKTGELISNELGMKYNAANYEKELEESYVIMNDISKNKVESIIEKLPEKYFKIKTNSNIPTLANVVIILGKENKIDTKIEVKSSTNDRTSLDRLKQSGYKNISFVKSEEKLDNPCIFYNSEDYFIAYKIAKLLGINNLLEKNELKNKIEILFD